MKKIFIIANWKSNKTDSEAKDWIEEIQSSEFRVQNSDKEVIVCPSFTLLSKLKSLIINHHLPINLGAQDISPFDSGAYTGEVNGKQIKEFADYVIIGHSERRRNFSENEELIAKKIIMAEKYSLIPILCVSNMLQTQNLKIKSQNYSQKLIITYEPLSAIGSGTPDTPENADQICTNIKKELGDVSVLYGGSVTSKNVREFTQMANIDGVLVGGGSLDPLEFLEIIKNA